jgi:two-component system, NarL family, nitrate/nitrite response regulator NarL
MKNKGLAADVDKIRIVFLEEYELFRESLCLLLAQQPGLTVIGNAPTWEKAFPVIQNGKPDIVLVASGSNDSNSIERLPEIFAVSENSQVLVLAKSEDPELHRQAVRLGAAGILSKDMASAMLIKAIERVHAGETWLDRFTTASLLRELSPRNRKANQDPEERKKASLTDREREVIQSVGKGLKNKQIADALFISDITVHHHLTSIYSKLEVADRFELLIYAYRCGLAEIPR